MKLINTFIPLLLMIGCSPFSASDYTKDLGHGYTFISESNSNQFITGPNDTTGFGLIPCTVEAFAFNETHIIAKQRQNIDCSNAINLSEVVPTYWIIDKEHKANIGPLDSLSFLSKRRELSVSNSLDLKE